MKIFKRIFNLINDFGNSLNKSNVSAFSGEATMFIFISFFPFIMFLLMLMKYTPLTADSLTDMIERVVPATSKGAIDSIINNIYTVSSGATVSFTLITLLWSASRGFLSLVRGLNSVYEVNETRKYLSMRLSSAFYAILLAILILFTLISLVFGNRIFAFLIYHFPKLNDLAILIISIRTIVSLCIYLLFFLFIYMVFPNRKSKLMYELPGALICSCGWLAFSYVYSYYVDHFIKNISMYGSLSALIFLMIWLYFCMNILFIGGKINQILRKTLSSIL